MKYFNFIVAILLTILYAIGKIPPSEKYNLWLIPFLIPFALAANILFLIISLILRKKSSIYFIVTLVIGSNYLLGTVGLKHFFSDQEFTPETFGVLSYNINAGLGLTAPLSDVTGTDSTVDLGAWILHQEAAIQCYQEFMYRKNGESDLIGMLNRKGVHTYFSHDHIEPEDERYVVGTLIVSKFPIVKSGDVLASDNGFNRIAYADIKLPKDTIRIVNLHLESMGLKVFHPGNTSGFQSRKENAKIIFSKLKEGVFERSEQIKTLGEFIESTPHAVICVGDFNELPYSYSYQFMKRRMKNAFEEVGKGFGFTYNGKTLRALRIDNQFYSSGVSAVKFSTRDDVRFSDHFPIEGTYKIDLP